MQNLEEEAGGDLGADIDWVYGEGTSSGHSITVIEGQNRNGDYADSGRVPGRLRRRNG